MGKRIILALKLSSKLMKGKKSYLFLLLLTIFFFKTEVSLLMPMIIYFIFDAIVGLNSMRLIYIVIGGTIIFLINVSIMCFINVYGDAWATKLSFFAIENVFKELKKLPIWSVNNRFNKDDFYQRIIDGTRSILGFYFILIDLMSNIISCILLTMLIGQISNIYAVLVIIYIIIKLLCVGVQNSHNNRQLILLQSQKSNSMVNLNSLIIDIDFHKKNQTYDLLHTKYICTRHDYYEIMGKKIVRDSIYDGLFKMYEDFSKIALVYNGIMNRELMQIYVNDIVTMYTVFEALCSKTNQLGDNLVQYPNSVIPINRLKELLKKDCSYTENEKNKNLSIDNFSLMINDNIILNNLSCKIPYGAKIAIVGENGSGKSTFLRVLAGLYESNEKKVVYIKEKRGYIPADDLLFASKSVMDNISFADKNISFDKIKKMLRNLDVCNESEFIDKIVSNLSGGEAKRVNLIRGITINSNIILADEPTSSLDAINARKVMDILLSIDSTVIYVTHSPELAMLADEIYVMENGKIVDKVKSMECEKSISYMEWEHKRNESEDKNSNY